MDAEIEFELTEELMTQAARRYAAHAYRWGNRLAGAIFALLLVSIAVLGALYLWTPQGRKLGWSLGALIVFAVIYPAIRLWSKRAIVRAASRSGAYLARLPHRTARWRIADEGIETTEPLGHRENPWDMFSAVWRFPDVWLFFVAETQFFAVPAELLSGEVGDFIAAKVEEHGGKVV
ncbi:YcxB family protein [Planctomycetota bacterium]